MSVAQYERLIKVQISAPSILETIIFLGSQKHSVFLTLVRPGLSAWALLPCQTPQFWPKPIRRLLSFLFSCALDWCCHSDPTLTPHVRKPMCVRTLWLLKRVTNNKLIVQDNSVGFFFPWLNNLWLSGSGVSSATSPHTPAYAVLPLPVKSSSHDVPHDPAQQTKPKSTTDTYQKHSSRILPPSSIVVVQEAYCKMTSSYLHCPQTLKERISLHLKASANRDIIDQLMVSKQKKTWWRRIFDCWRQRLSAILKGLLANRSGTFVSVAFKDTDIDTSS